MTEHKYFKKMQAFCDSALLQYLYLIAAMCILLFSKAEEHLAVMIWGNYLLIYGIAAFAIVATVQLIFARHIVSTVLPFLLICCWSLKCYDSFGVFMDFLPLLLPVGIAFIIALIVRVFVIYRRPFRPTLTFWSLLPVSISVAVGGLGFISLTEYKGMIYYVIGLGVGLMLLCALFSCQYEDDHTYDLADYYERTMSLVVLFAVFMVLHHYIKHWDTFWETKKLLDFQWRNNISTILMIALPFPFAKAHKNFAWFLVGLAGGATLLLAFSRGGILFGMIELAVCIIVYLIRERGLYQKIVFGMLGVGLIAGVWVIIAKWDAFQHAFYRLFYIFDPVRLQKEARYKMFIRAWESFKEHPFLGQGLGYNGTKGLYNPREGALYFYHCAPAQIIASLGSVGIVAYLSQCVMQARVLLKNRSVMSATVAISICALWGMSMVNPGIFSPVPYAMMIPLNLIVVEKIGHKRKSL